MICEKCGKSFDKDYRKDKRGISRFCSRKCANSREFSEESKELKSMRNKKYYKSNEVSRNITTESQEAILKGLAKGRINSVKSRKEKTYRKIKEYLKEGGYGSFKDYSFGKNSFKKYVMSVKENKCYICGISDIWNGKPLVLQLEHVDGDAKNNSLENVELICPNCHSQTDTYCGKNRGKSTRDFYITTRNI